MTDEMDAAEYVSQKDKKRPKYLNHKVIINGIQYDSGKEAERHAELLVFEELGQISMVQHHPQPMVIQERFKYDGKTIRAITYQPDFSYIENGKRVIEDVKPWDKKNQKVLTTEAFKLKWKLLKAKNPDIVFRIVAM